MAGRWLAPYLRHVSRRVGVTISVVAALAVAMASTLWWWSGRDDSLAQTLAWAQRWLPEGQSLQSRDVAGSVRHGGHIGWLQWKSPALTIDVEDAQALWDWTAWWQGRLQLSTLRAHRISIETHADAPETPRAAPPTHLALPVPVHAPFHVDELRWGTAASAQLQALSGQYTFDGQEHQAQLDSLQWAQGHYQGRARVQAHEAMQLDATLQAQVTVNTGASPHTLQLEASAHGSLATSDAKIAVQATAAPQHPNTATASAPHAQLQATVQPWAAMPLHSAQLDLHAIDAAAWWPQAPHTALQGRVTARTTATQWQLQAALNNPLAGAWDQQRLPLSQLQAEAEWNGQEWHLTQGTARFGEAADALQWQGRYTPATGAVQGQVQLTRLRPQRLWSTLPPAIVSGRIQAHTPAAPTLPLQVHFDADVRSQAAATALQLTTQGHWQQGGTQTPSQWQLNTLQIAALDARVRATDLQVRQAPTLAQWRWQGQLQTEAPGSTLTVQGHLDATEGQGSGTWAITDAQRLQRWLRALPLADRWQPAALREGAVTGQGQLHAQWSSGWDALLATPRATPKATPHPPAWDVRLNVPQARFTPPANDTAAVPMELQGLTAQWAGRAEQARLSVAARAQVQGQRVQWDLQGQSAQTTPSDWSLQLTQAHAQWTPPGHTTPWVATLRTTPVQLRLQTRPPTTVHIGAGRVDVSGPQSGTASIDWAQSQTTWEPATPPRVQTQGQILGLPLAWLQALASPGAATRTTSAATPTGLRTDMMLQGQWAIDTLAAPRAQLSVRRVSGDITLPDPRVTQGPWTTTTTAPTTAGVKEAQILLTLDQDRLQTQWQWRSERAGRLQAQLRTTWAYGSPWAADAPVDGQLQADLPDVGLWSAWAPPGWRVQGTLNAQARLAGTRAIPRWDGTLAADGLAVRSRVDGIDLHSGRLRATLAENQLQIQELKLAGGQGSKARIAGPSGNRTPAPANGGELQATGRIAWTPAPTGSAAPFTLTADLQAQLNALQVLVRADRQLSLSGAVRAQLQHERLQLRGALRVDRASLWLTDENTPTLGSDVVVVRGPTTPQPTHSAPEEPQGAPAITPEVDLTLNLGDDFALQGHGLTTRLQGEVQLRNASAGPIKPTVTGEIKTDQGRYRAWGQTLDVESGTLRFNGPLDNPALDILALRPHLSVQAGVHVTGSAQSPRVTLYSNPDMPDAEKLGWVVLGRSSAATGAEAAVLQQATVALLGQRGQNVATRVAQRLGLDEVGLRSATASDDATTTALTLGKRLSKDLYVSYERSLSSTVGTLYIFYDLTRQFTLRGQTGNTSAVDVIYTMRYD